METFTIQQIMPTGKSSPTYGTEYNIKFVESEQAFALWFKTDPQLGQKIDGTIEGTKFKKAKKEWNPSQQSSSSQPSQSSSGRSSNNDGVRQGMCINNASNYVNTVSQKPLSAEEWATQVSDYARALYKKSDLNETNELETTVADIFGQ